MGKRHPCGLFVRSAGLGLQRGKDFHSFRHTVADHLKQKDIQESKAQVLLGHETDSMTYGNYANPYSAAAIVDAVAAIDHGTWFHAFSMIDYRPGRGTATLTLTISS